MDVRLQPRARALGDRLGDRLGALLHALPPRARGITGLARYLQVGKSTCQRVVEGVRAEGTEVIRDLPGSAGLRAVVEASRSRGVDSAVCDAALDAIEALDGLVADAGGSKARLLAALDAIERFGGPREDSEEAERRDLVEAAGRLLADLSDVRLTVRAYAPGSEGRLRRYIAVGQVGLRRAPGAGPLLGAHIIRDGDDHADAGPALIEGFSTPGVQIRRDASPHPAGYWVEGQRPGEPFTYLIEPRPPYDGPTGPIRAASFLQTPTRGLLVDLFVHRDLPFRGAPSCAARPPDRNNWVMNDPSADERWPHAVLPAALGPALRHPTSTLWPRLSDAEKALFERWKLNPGEFTGYRVELRYPIWCALYTVSLG